MTRNIQATDEQGNKVNDPIKINGITPTGDGGIFEDTTGDGIYEQQTGSGLEVPSLETESVSGTGNPTAVSGTFDGGDWKPAQHLDQEVVTPGDDVQAAVDAVDFSASDERQSGVVVFKSDRDTFFDLSSTTLPVDVPEGVSLHMPNCFINVGTATGAVFDMAQGTTVFAPNSLFRDTADVGAFFRFDGDQHAITTAKPARILGWPLVQTRTAGVVAVELTQTAGSSVAGVGAEIRGWNSGPLVNIVSSGTGGFVNANRIKIGGAVADGDAVTITGAAPAKGNLIDVHELQVKSGVGRIVLFDGGSENIARGKFADPVNATTPWEWTAASGNYNRIYQRADTVPTGTDNSGQTNTGAFTSWLA